ncbi:dual specificity phosphatase 29 [Hydra vulgaris]|uniref:Dual specificity phosphatase 29 n=1 Tax=Hydra vulgaris TaxID=6087 RepID=A0ABM4DK07_HYDVU
MAHLNYGLNSKQLRYANHIIDLVANVSQVPKKMTKLLDHLYLGAINDAMDVDHLKEAGITHIINTVHNIDGENETGAEFYGDEFIYMGFFSEDREDYPILENFEKVQNFINSARDQNGKCLIHCMAGINRSGCLATAYYMIEKDIGPVTAVSEVFEKRGVLLTNKGFIKQLVKFSVDRKLLTKDKHLLRHSTINNCSI